MWSPGSIRITFFLHVFKSSIISQMYLKLCLSHFWFWFVSVWLWLSAHIYSLAHVLWVSWSSRCFVFSSPWLWESLVFIVWNKSHYFRIHPHHYLFYYNYLLWEQEYVKSKTKMIKTNIIQHMLPTSSHRSFPDGPLILSLLNRTFLLYLIRFFWQLQIQVEWFFVSHS